MVIQKARIKGNVRIRKSYLLPSSQHFLGLKNSINAEVAVFWGGIRLLSYIYYVSDRKGAEDKTFFSEFMPA